VPATREQRFELGFATAQLLAARARGDAALASQAGAVVLGAIDDASSPVASRDVRTYASLNLGIVDLWLGRLDDAVRHLERARRGAEATGALWIKLLALGHLAAVAAFSGNARRARLLSEDALRFAGEHGWARTWPAGMAETALSAAALDGNDVREAERFYQRGAELLSLASDRPLLAGSVLHAARLDLAGGRPDAALQKVDRYLDTIGDWPIMREFGGLAASVRARALAAVGRAHEGARVVEFAQSVAPTAHAAAALGHLRLLQGDPEGALDAIELEDGVALTGVLTVEAGLVAALAHDAKADHPAAADSLERALDAAEPEGVRSPFAMLGPNVRVILRRQIRLGTAHRSLVDELLREVEQPVAARETRAVFAEELSDREAAVLRFLPTMMSNNEIAAELFVSVNTVKSHLKSIYRKLDVADRRHAVRRAREMQLIGP